ncbi:hypothetical protein JWJ90_18310 [Desulfobulbus rhabdoformis]|jgi:hypothetical protein|uniref:hypothetical protein n=1 Tax=Desulfobulbus rhabdoformis TaxID=34032 RepID=UPI0019646634|nr:hypothetical protein [Desulfobulbus rhabdoformis]MBM9616225.1 hypothetical protein [Desulfobulbus rhabdoformis]
MHLFRRIFYLLIGFTFPGFWVFHASGMFANLYLPLQRLLHSQSPLFPALITASLLYLVIICCFEFVRILIRRIRAS